MVPVDESAAGSGRSGRSGGSLPFLHIECHSCASGMNVPGSGCSLKGTLVAV